MESKLEEKDTDRGVISHRDIIRKGVDLHSSTLKLIFLFILNSRLYKITWNGLHHEADLYQPINCLVFMIAMIYIFIE